MQAARASYRKSLPAIEINLLMTSSQGLPPILGERVVAGSLAQQGLFFILFCFSKATAIPSRKRKGGGCARGWCVRRGS